MKKALALSMALAMSAAMLAGCGGSASGSTSASSAASSADSAASGTPTVARAVESETLARALHVVFLAREFLFGVDHP